MLVKSSCSPPSGLTVAHTVVRCGMPPTLRRPALAQFVWTSLYEGRTPVVGSCSCPASAWHEAVPAPLEPAHVHIHGPVPVTPDAVPALQRLVVGLLVRSVRLAGPHAPLTCVLCAAADALPITEYQQEWY